MPDGQVVNQVEKVLSKADLPFVRGNNANGEAFMIPGHKSAVVVIDFDDWPDTGTTIIRLHANVLEKVHGDRAKILDVLNSLNLDQSFNKFYFDEDQALIVAEYDLPGGHVQPDELVNLVAAMVTIVERCDEELQRVFGGERGVDAWNRMFGDQPAAS